MKEEFLAGGLENWPEHQVLELILFYSIPQGDVNPLAHALIHRFGSLAGVLDAPVEELTKVKGVGRHTAACIKLMLAVNRRYLAERSSPGQMILNIEAARDALAPSFYGALHEKVVVLCMDGKGKLLGVKDISEGDLWSSEVNVRRVAEECVRLRASYCYLAHNHVSNLALPSEADWNATNVVRTALMPLGIQLLDHLVFVDGDMVSIKLSHRAGRPQIYQMLPIDDWDG